jgi:hypothetical protein
MDSQNNKRKLMKLSLICNLAVVVMGLIADGMDIAKGGETPLRFYTEDSNLLAQLACAVMAVYQIISLKTGRELPGWVTTLKYVAACCLTVTFLVVIFVLAPTYGIGGYYFMLLTGTMLYMHLLCPIVCVGSLLLFDSGAPLPRRAPLIALAPTAVYAVVTTILNVARVMEGPYPFLMVYKQPVWASVLWLIAIPGGAYLIALLLYKLSLKVSARRTAAENV